MSASSSADTDAGSVLDNPIWESLSNDHRRFAHRDGGAAAYGTDVALFAGAPPDVVEPDWAALMATAGRDRVLVQRAEPGPPAGAGWERTRSLAVQQMVLTGPMVPPGPTASSPGDPLAWVALGPGDVTDMLTLVGLTRPGPFGTRTVELGGYVGVRSSSGDLVAMAGTRLSPPGWVEISGVCTHPSARGRGLAWRSMACVAERIEASGRRPFLHVASDNERARSLYEAMGFTSRRGFVIETLERVARR